MMKIKPNELAMTAMRVVAQDLRIVAEANERASVVARAAILAMEAGDIASAIDRLAEMVRISVDIEPRIELLTKEWGRVSMLDPVAWSAAAPRQPAQQQPQRPNVTIDTTGALDEVARILGLDPQVLVARIVKIGPRPIESVELLETVEEAQRALSLHSKRCSGGERCRVHRDLTARIRQLGGAP